MREALRLGHNHVGTEHLLLGLQAEQTGLAAQVLTEQGLSPEGVGTEYARKGPRPDVSPGQGQSEGLRAWAWFDTVCLAVSRGRVEGSRHARA